MVRNASWAQCLKSAPLKEKRKSWFDESVEEFGEPWLSGVAAEDEYKRTFSVREMSPRWVGKPTWLSDRIAEPRGCWHNVTPLDSIPHV